MTEVNLKANVPTHEVSLENGDVVVLYDYLTTGESRQIQKLLLEKGEFDPQSQEIKNLPLAVFFESQEKAASFVIKEVKVSGGDAKPFSPEWLDNLPQAIGDVVYEEINKITNMSQLASDKKKDS